MALFSHPLPFFHLGLYCCLCLLAPYLYGWFPHLHPLYAFLWITHLYQGKDLDAERITKQNSLDVRKPRNFFYEARNIVALLWKLWKRTDKQRLRSLFTYKTAKKKEESKTAATFDKWAESRFVFQKFIGTFVFMRLSCHHKLFFKRFV